MLDYNQLLKDLDYKEKELLIENLKIFINSIPIQESPKCCGKKMKLYKGVMKKIDKQEFVCFRCDKKIDWYPLEEWRKNQLNELDNIKKQNIYVDIDDFECRYSKNDLKKIEIKFEKHKWQEITNCLDYFIDEFKVNEHIVSLKNILYTIRFYLGQTPKK